MSDGSEFDLHAESIPPAGVSAVSVNAALENLPPTLSSHLSTFGSVALNYTDELDGAIDANITNINFSESLSYSYPFKELTSDSALPIAAPF